MPIRAFLKEKEGGGGGGLANANRNEQSRGRSPLRGQDMGKTQDHRNRIEQRLAVGGGWQLVVSGSWRLAVGGPGDGRNHRRN